MVMVLVMMLVMVLVLVVLVMVLVMVMVMVLVLVLVKLLDFASVIVLNRMQYRQDCTQLGFVHRLIYRDKRDIVLRTKQWELWMGCC